MLTSLSIRNFLGVRALDLECAAPGVTLVCGDNFSGKTSTQQAIRLAFTGEVPRVDLKRDYHMLIRDGADEATISADNRLLRIKRGLEGEIPPADLVLPYLLDPGRLGDAKPDELAAVILSASGFKPDGADLRARLKDAGVSDMVIDELAPLFAGGFAPARAEAQAKAKELRAQWQGITRERYGAEKARSWRPDVSAQIKAIDEAAAGALEAKNTAARMHAAIAAARPELDDLDRDIELLRTGHLARLKECPACEARLMHVHGELVTVDAYHAKLRSDADLAKMSKRADTLRAQIKEYEAKAAAATRILEIAAAGATEQGRIAAEADATAKDAANVYHHILLWERAADALAPDRVPADMAAPVLDSLSRHISKQGAETGLGVPAVGRDMAITFKGRAFGLLSESEQWVCTALLAEALATISGHNVIMLDRLDVMAPARRGAIVQWLRGRAKDGMQSILFATLKEPPKAGGVAVKWIGA